MRDTIHSLAGGNKIAFLLLSIFLISIIYPFADTGAFAALFLAGLYLVLLGSAIYLVSSDRFLLTVNVALTIAIAVLAAITILSDFTAPLWIQLVWNATVLLQQVLIVALLVTFIIQSEAVTREVLYAAVAIYLFIAALFAQVYVIIEGLAPGSFLSSSGAENTPTRLTYFSFVTLTTLGYGDIVPVAPVALSLSTLEASIGTLYIAILIGRFVSLYQSDG